jgi:hypothetical protein
VNHALNTYFGQVYVINLKSRVDRRVEMRAQLQRIGLNFEAANLALFEASKPTEPAGFPSIGARGCFLSHLSVLRDAREKGVRSVLILEDDLNFCDGFSAGFSEVSRWLGTTEWGIFYGCYALSEPLGQSDAPCVQVTPSRLLGTSAFVAVNGPHIGALVDYLEAMLTRPAGDELGGPMHVDGAYFWFRQSHPQVQTWLARRPLGYQRSSKTDVHALRWYDRNLWSAWVVSRIRQGLNKLRL